MSKNIDVFLKRMFLYRMQDIIAAIIAVVIWYGIFVFFCYLEAYYNMSEKYSIYAVFFAPIFIFSLFNSVTYFYSKCLAEKYGIEMFGDLDQDWLKEHQAFDSKAFGDVFARLIQCRKIAGPYMLAVIIPLACIHMYLATGVGALYCVVYTVYRSTYLDTAISYKIPRAFGGGGSIISKFIDETFNKKIDTISKKLESQNKNEDSI